MATAKALTDKAVKAAKGPSTLSDGSGLLLKVSESGSKAWIFRYQLDGKRRDMGLGPYPEVSLARAREKAQAQRVMLKDSRTDPLEAEKARKLAARIEAAKGRTFRECAEEYIEKNRAGWRNAKHAQQWQNTLNTYVYDILGKLPVSSIDAGLVLQVLEQPVTGGTLWTAKPETAGRVRGRIEAVLDSAKVRGYRDGPNPAQWRGNLALLLPARGKVRKVVHHAALPFNDMGAFMKALRGRDSTSARALEFAILTAARTGEILGATWKEIDLDAKVWTVPAARMKAGREHRVPLCDAALAVLALVRSHAEDSNGKLNRKAPVFPTPASERPLSGMALLMLLRRMKRGDLTAHGFRSTFSDWAAERTAYPREVVEMALAHSISDKTEAAYRRGDLFEKRRKLMEAWAAFCSAPAGSKVTNLRGARKRAA